MDRKALVNFSKNFCEQMCVIYVRVFSSNIFIFESRGSLFMPELSIAQLVGIYMSLLDFFFWVLSLGFCLLGFAFCFHFNQNELGEALSERHSDSYLRYLEVCWA